MNRNILARCIPLVMVLTLTHCGTRQNDPVIPNQGNLDYALAQAVASAIIPATERFADTATDLQTAASEYCTNFTSETLSAAREAWQKATLHWFRLAAYRFGPLTDDLVLPPYIYVDSLRLRGTQYLTTVRDEMEDDVFGDQALTLPYFAGKPFQQVGLLAIEVALFETAGADHSNELTDINDEYQANPRKCEVLSHLTELLAQRAHYFNDGWVASYRGDGPAYRTLFGEAELEDGTPPLTLLLTSVQEYLDYLHNRNVAAAATPVAEISWQAIAAALTEVERLLEGEDGQSISLFGIMRGGGYDQAVATVRQNLAFAQEAIANRNRTDLHTALALLDGNFKREIPNGLNVSLGINFSDGD